MKNTKQLNACLGSLKHQKMPSAAKMTLVVSKSSFNAVELMMQYVVSLN